MSATSNIVADELSQLSETNRVFYDEIKKSPPIAGILSLLFVGLGQFYHRQFAGGIVFILMFFVGVSLTRVAAGYVLLLVLYGMSIYMAVTEARRRNRLAYALLKDGDKERALLMARTGAMTKPSVLVTLLKLVVAVVMWLILWTALRVWLLGA